MKRLMYLFLLLVFTLVVKSQEKIFYNQNGDVVLTLQEAKYYKIKLQNVPDSDHFAIKTYFKTGQIKSEVNYLVSDNKLYTKKEFTNLDWTHTLDHQKDINRFSGIADGNVLTYLDWFNTLGLHKDINRFFGVIDGKVLTYYESGQLKRSDLFLNNNLINGKCYDQKGKEISHFDYEVKPRFIEGENSLLHFIGKHIYYPASAGESSIQGKVIIAFVVEKDGSLSSFNVLRSLEPEFDKIALDAVKLTTKKWNPGLLDGVPSNFITVIPVAFRLE